MSDAPAILVVEDEWLLASMIVTMLRAAGHAVLEPVNSVPAALDSIARQAPAFALLDVTLGRRDSFPVAEALERRGVPFALMTGYTAADLPPAFRHHTILQKPVGRAALLAAARAGLDARRP